LVAPSWQYTATSGGMDPAPLSELMNNCKLELRTRLVKAAESNAERAQRAKLVRFKSHLRTWSKKSELSTEVQHF